MNKENIFRSGEFFMSVGDILHILIIDESGDPVTLTLVGEGIADDVPNAPVANAASDILSTSFTANWNFMENSTGYFLDVAEDSAFTSFVAGYNNKDVGDVISDSVVGLTEGIQYYYRIRAYNPVGTSIDSNIITSTTTQTYNDFFLPSLLEWDKIYSNIISYLLGDFNIAEGSEYWTSSGVGGNPNVAFRFYFTEASSGVTDKSQILHVRACRSFSTTDIYDLRDIGPAGGLIFHIIDLGGGNYTCFEVAPMDIADSAWSNIINEEVAIGITIGTGQANTTAIIGQVGHIDSAAKLCDDLIIVA